MVCHFSFGAQRMRRLHDGLPSLSSEASLRQDDRSNADALDTANRRGEASSCRCVTTIRSLLLQWILALLVVGGYLSLFAYVEGNSMSYETVVLVNNATETARALRRRELEQKRVEHQEQRRAPLDRSIRRRDMAGENDDDDDNDRDNRRRREKPPKVSLWRVVLMYLLVRYWINLHRNDNRDALDDENNVGA
jgi:hypothetical protein